MKLLFGDNVFWFFVFKNSHKRLLFKSSSNKVVKYVFPLQYFQHSLFLKTTSRRFKWQLSNLYTIFYYHKFFISKFALYFVRATECPGQR